MYAVIHIPTGKLLQDENISTGMKPLHTYHFHKTKHSYDAMFWTHWGAKRRLKIVSHNTGRPFQEFAVLRVVDDHGLSMTNELRTK